MADNMKETILRAAEGFGGEPFSLGELAVAAWSLDPAAVGIPGFEELYPDTKRVHMTLYGPRGLLTLGKIVNAESGKYRAPMAQIPEVKAS